MNWKFISGLILLIILVIYIIFYPLQFDFYESQKAKRIADFIVIPAFFLLVVYDLFRNIKKGENDWKKYMFDVAKGFALFAVVYFLILRSFISSGIIWVNTIFGEKEVVKINGTITGKIDRKGSGKYVGTYELRVTQNGKEFIFESNHKSIESYQLNEQFDMEMKKGILNLIYK